MSKELLAQLRRDEGEVLNAYQDSLGYWTIGIGRLIDKRKGGGITQAESSYLLANDITRATVAVLQYLPWASVLSPARLGVLLNMTFQMGIDGLLKFTNTLAMIKAGRYEAAAAGMLQSKWAEQTPARALRLSEQMRTGEWQ